MLLLNYEGIPADVSQQQKALQHFIYTPQYYLLIQLLLLFFIKLVVSSIDARLPPPPYHTFITPFSKSKGPFELFYM